MLKFVKEYPEDDFKFRTSGAVLIFFAVPKNNNPLPEDFKYTQDLISVLKVNPKDKPIKNRIVA